MRYMWITTALFQEHFQKKQEYKDLDLSIDRVVSVLHNADHYSVTEANIFHHDMKVYDSLKHPLMRWANNVENILMRCKLVDR